MLHLLLSFLVRVLHAVIGLAMVAFALTLGFIVAGGVLLRLAWLRARTRAGRSPSTGALRAGAARGEIIDIEVREIRA